MGAGSEMQLRQNRLFLEENHSQHILTQILKA